MKFILLINVKIPPIVGILTFISMINTSSEYFKQETILFFQYCTFSEQSRKLIGACISPHRRWAL